MFSECLPIDEILASSMDAGVTTALVHLGQTRGVVVALGAQTGEAVDAINTRAPIVTWVNGALVDVDVAHYSWKTIRFGFSTC